MTGEYGAAMEELLQRIVRLHGVYVGHVVDVILDPSEGSPIGLEVRCQDGRHRFLPWAAATTVGDEIVIDSPFAILDGDELAFYRERGVTLRERGEPSG
jgi:sporulation protein YlmC with PRC-barrel domain